MQEVLLDELRANRQQIRELAAAQKRLQAELDRLAAGQNTMTETIDAALLTIALNKERTE